MSIISLLITEKWRSRPSSLQIPERPGVWVFAIFDNLDDKNCVYHTKDEYIASWLIENGYCVAAPCVSENALQS